jgi:hypothetical protein
MHPTVLSGFGGLESLLIKELRDPDPRCWPRLDRGQGGWRQPRRNAYAVKASGLRRPRSAELSVSDRWL